MPSLFNKSVISAHFEYDHLSLNSYRLISVAHFFLDGNTTFFQDRTFRRLIGLLFILLLSSSITGCTYYPQAERFQPSGLNSHFEINPQKSYRDYVESSRQMIAQARLDLKNAALKSQDIIDGNAPYILEPDASCLSSTDRAILMIHGLTDSPYTLKNSARFFQRNCFSVYGLLLTGHGTRPGDLRDVHYDDWVKQVQYAMQQLQQNHQTVYLGGFSMGGILAIDYVLSHPKQSIAGLFLLSPSLNITAKAAFARWIAWFKPWVAIYDDLDVMKYESFATNAVVQIYDLTQQVRQKLEDNDTTLKKVPVFAAFTAEDRTIKALDSLRVLLKHTDEQRRYVLLYHQGAFPEEFRNTPNLFGKKSVIPKQRILDLSHLSLGRRENDRWYGRKGLYRNCLHYYADRQQNEDYQKCKTSSQVWYGEETKKNLEQGILVRITFSPFLQNLFEQVRHFFQWDQIKNISMDQSIKAKKDTMIVVKRH